MVKAPALNRPLLGIAFMAGGISLNTVKDALAKMMAEGMSAPVLLWMQFLFTALVLAAILWPRYGPAALKPVPLGPQVLRTLGMMIGVGCFYWAVGLIPLADTTAMSLLAPILVTALSPFLLSEKVGPFRWTAVIIGFIGVLFILKPGFAAERTGYVIALGSGVGLSLFYIMNRKLGRNAPPLVNVFTANLMGAVLLTPVMIFLLPGTAMAGPWALGVFLVFAFIGQVFVISSFSYGEGATVAPFQYAQIVTATLAGYVVFSEFPDWVTWIGIALVVGSGIFIALREARLNRARSRHTRPPVRPRPSGT